MNIYISVSCVHLEMSQEKFVLVNFNQNYELPLVTGFVSEMIITGLKPETNYEVRLSAINGKGEGERSPEEFFKTEKVRKCIV